MRYLNPQLRWNYCGFGKTDGRHQWRRNEFESGGRGGTGPAQSAGKNFFTVPPHFSRVPP